VKHELPFDWEYKTHPRRKKVGVFITSDGRVELRAPIRFSRSKAEAFLAQNAKWVLSRLAQLPKIEEDSEDLVTLFGQPYQLIIKPSAAPYHCEQEQLIYLPSRDSLVDYQRQLLTHIITERLAHWLAQISHWREQPNRVRVRAMKTRWGSCSAARNISLALMLVEQPLELIDYVIVHELCHLREMNHSRAYWSLVESLMPDWKRRRQQLNKRN